MFDDRRYIILDATEIGLINFNEVMETSTDTLRYSLDGTKTFIKYEGESPAFLDDLATADGPYTHDEILTILVAGTWTTPPPDPEL